jgi:AraC family transcriptional regulator
MSTSSPNPVFTIQETHARVLRPENRLIAHSEDLGWRSLYAAILEEGPLEASEAPVHHPSFIYHLTRPTVVTRSIEGSHQETGIIEPRRLSLTPGEASTHWQHSGRPEILQVYLRQSIYAKAVNEIFGLPCSAVDASADIIPRFAIVDPLLEQLAIAVADALREGTEDGLYIESVAQMMAVHLARTHSSHSKTSHATASNSSYPKISSWKMRHLSDYVEQNLDGDLSLEAMAQVIEISPLYLPRAFKAAYGRSPHQYVLTRRVEKAKELLRSTSLPVVEVALAVGFSSQSHLANWFLRLVGVAPAAYRKQH